MINNDNKRPEENEDLYSAFDNPVRPEDKAPKKRRVSARTRTLIIALTAVVVLVGLQLLIPLLPEETAGSSSTVDSSDAVTHTLLEKKAKDKNTVVVNEVAVNIAKETSADTFVIRHQDEEEVYLLDGYEDLSLNSYAVETLTDCATTFTAQDKLDTVGNLKDYGLDKPMATATVTYHDNSKATIKIGNRTPDEAGYYVTIDDKAVYISNESMVAPFLMTKNQYVDTTLLSAPTADKDDQDGKAVLKELNLTGTAFQKPLSIRRISADDPSEFSYFSYVVTQPYYRGVSETAASELGAFTSLTATQAIVLHPTKQQLTDFGFNKPGIIAKVSVAIETSGETKDDSQEATTVYYNTVETTISIGSRDDAGDYYVMAEGINAVFRVATNQLSGIAERRYENTISDQLFLKDITTLSRMAITVDGQTYPYQFAHHPTEEESDNKLTVTMNGKQYPTGDFRLLYQLAMGIERYGQTEKQPTGDPVLSIALYLKNGERYLEVDFYSTTGSLSTARTSEGEIFTVKTSEVNDFIKQASNYVNGQKVLINY